MFLGVVKGWGVGWGSAAPVREGSTAVMNSADVISRWTPFFCVVGKNELNRFLTELGS